MLKTKRQITLTGNSMIDNQSAVTLNATIPSDTGVGNINQYVQNASLYEANKTQIRNDQREFQNLVWETEDRLAARAEPEEPLES